MGVLAAAFLIFSQRVIGLVYPPAIGAFEGRTIPGKIARDLIGPEAVEIRRGVGRKGLDLEYWLLPTIADDQIIPEMDVGSRPQRSGTADEGVVVNQDAGGIIEQLQRTRRGVVV